MDPETQLDARLDALLSRRGDGGRRGAADGADPRPEEALAPLLAAAGRLDGLRAAAPSAGFARALEARLLAHADEAQALQAGADELTQADLPRAPRVIRPSGPARPAPVVPLARPERRARPPVPYARWGAIAAALLLAFGLGAFTAAANADPGSPFYGLQSLQHDVQVQFTSSAAGRADLHLQYADDALRQLQAEARKGNGGAYANALGRLRTEEQAARTSLNAVPAGAQYDALAARLDDLHGRMRQGLAAALPQIGWANRLSTTDALAGLGVSVPHVTAATIARLRVTGGSGDGGDAGEHTWQIVVSGSGFAPGAALYLDGQPAGKVTSVTPTRLVATVQSDDAARRAQAVGVANPNGAADQTGHIARPNDDGGGGGDDGSNDNKTPTPAPTSTPDDHSGHGGH